MEVMESERRVKEKIKEILPDLSDEIVEVLMVENGFDLEKSLNAGLTYKRIEELEENNENNFKNIPDIIEVNQGSATNCQSILIYPEMVPSNDSNHKVQKNAKPNRICHRGSMIELPENFLVAPRCRISEYRVYSDRIEYAVIFKRQNAKIGLNIGVLDGLVTVIQVQKSNSKFSYGEFLSEVSGVLEGDIILGVNHYYFSPFADKDDIVTILDCSKPLTKIHFLRTANLSYPDRLNLHPYVTYVKEAKIITPHHAFLVTVTLTALKEKVLRWKNLEISKLYCSYMDHSLKNLPSMSRQQSKVVNFAIFADFSQFVEMIRPAFVVRVLRFEMSSDGLSIITILWVMDVLSGIEWILKKNYFDFFEFYETACFLRSSIQAVDFSLKKSSNLQEILNLSDEILPVLQRLINHIIKITSYHSFLPSIFKIQLLFLKFLEVPKYHSMLQERRISGGNMIRVFIHHVLLLNSLETMINSFIEEYLSHQVEDLEKAWTVSEAEEVLLQLRKFIDQVHLFLLKFFYHDCEEIFRSYYEPFQEFHLLWKDSESYQDYEYEMVRAFVRKQVEAEIYIRCVDRVKFIVNAALKKTHEVYDEKIVEISEAPLSRFELKENFLSRESWWGIIEKFKEFRSPSLPSDKIDALVAAFKFLSTVYQYEHSLETENVGFGADELIPCFIYVFAKAVIPELIYLNFEIQLLSDPNAALSERGYCLATLDATVSHILEYDANSNFSPHKKVIESP